MPTVLSLSRPWGKLTYQSYGGGQVLLLLHTIGRNSRDFAPIVSLLSKNLRCICVDLCGHGESTVPRQSVTLRTMARDIIALIEENYLGKCALAGHGMGGMVALEVLRQRPDLAGKVILLDTFLPVTLRQSLYGEEIIPIFDFARLQEFRRTLARWVVAIREDLLIIANTYTAQELMRESLREVLFLYGDRGLPRPDRTALQIPARQNFIVHWLNHGTHFFPLEQPTETARILQTFINDNSTDFSAPPPDEPDRDLPPPSLGELLLIH